MYDLFCIKFSLLLFRTVFVFALVANEIIINYLQLLITMRLFVIILTFCHLSLQLICVYRGITLNYIEYI